MILFRLSLVLLQQLISHFETALPVLPLDSPEAIAEWLIRTTKIDLSTHTFA
jgi:hypothetical protein